MLLELDLIQMEWLYILEVLHFLVMLNLWYEFIAELCRRYIN